MLELKNISKNLGEFSLNNINISVKEKEYFVILGISGAGKSVLLEMIAGLLKPDSGSIVLSEQDITHEKIQHRDIGIVFQDHAVFPHMSVYKNIMYPLKNMGTPKTKAKEIVHRFAALMNIDHLLDRMPSTLSGGEKQRLALARTLVLEPKYLLLDEPLASVDAQLKSELRFLLRKINRMGITIVHVTHDYEEAISLAERVAVIYQGELIQTGTSKEVFNNPKSKFLANFTGIKNFFSAKGLSENLSIAEDKVKVHHYKETADSDGYILFRSEDVIVSAANNPSSTLNNFEGKIIDIFPNIHGMELLIDIGIEITAHVTNESVKHLQLELNKNVWVSFKSTAVKFIPHE
ncbi:ABC transporter ATP-binding protein [Labilibacter marinus]|uniref:ABC transporter ATP-binding protein n=1 Tax=Labilibacter marinus TaxID=1477105 RepID=UPI00083528DD|nr:ABC transporter ATP-binding protein [Labilibacter marinus]